VRCRRASNVEVRSVDATAVVRLGVVGRSETAVWSGQGRAPTRDHYWRLAIGVAIAARSSASVRSVALGEARRSGPAPERELPKAR